MIRLALLSNWHVHAADYARDTLNHPDAELTLIWDEDPDRGREAAARFGGAFEGDLDRVLGDPGIDGVIVTSATSDHLRLIPAAARAGKHIFAEKVIAPTLLDSLAIVQSIEAAGVVAAIALTRAEQPSTRAAISAISTGVVGRVTSVRVRLAHDGALPTPEQPDGWLPVRFYDRAAAGGGALIDLGAHPLYVTRRFLGMPDSITAIFGDLTGRGVDDNSVVVFGTESGAYGVAETGFVSRGGGFRFEIRGTDGTIAYEQGSESLTVQRKNAPSEELPIAGVDEPPFARWIRAIHGRTPLMGNLNLALELSALAEAAARSASSGRRIEMNSLDGWSELTLRAAKGVKG